MHFPANQELSVHSPGPVKAGAEMSCLLRWSIEASCTLEGIHLSQCSVSIRPCGRGTGGCKGSVETVPVIETHSTFDPQSNMHWAPSHSALVYIHGVVRTDHSAYFGVYSWLQGSLHWVSYWTVTLPSSCSLCHLAFLFLPWASVCCMDLTAGGPLPSERQLQGWFQTYFRLCQEYFSSLLSGVTSETRLQGEYLGAGVMWHKEGRQAHKSPVRLMRVSETGEQQQGSWSDPCCEKCCLLLERHCPSQV